MTTSQCAYLVSTRKGYAGVHQCQGEGKKVTHTLIQALLMLVSCTLKTSQVELPLHFLNWCFFGWQKGEGGGPLRDLVPKYQWKLWILGLCRREQTRFSWKCVWQKNKNKGLFAQHKNPDVDKTNNISITACVCSLKNPDIWKGHIKSIRYRHKPTWTHQKFWLRLVKNSRTDSPIPDCQAETKGWELLVLKQKRFGLLGGAPDRFIWNPRGEKTAFYFYYISPSICQPVLYTSRDRLLLCQFWL